ncbi:MAG: arsenic resistance N-acetyltransferase ArsN2 [Bacteroidota bacterium]
MDYQIVPVTGDTIKAATGLLASYDLPTEDLHHPEVSLFALKKEGEEQILGTIGLEKHGTFGLLRSLAVSPVGRGKKLGERLVAFLEQEVRTHNLEALYLLTTTAAPYFEKIGFLVVDRMEVPLAIQQTREFADLCPASAVVMRRDC